MFDFLGFYRNLIHETGLFVLKALVWLNGVALAFAYQPHTFPSLWPLVAPYFLAGVVASFAGLAATYLAAQVAISGRDLSLTWFVFMCGLPALALVFFCLGITASFGVLK